MRSLRLWCVVAAVLASSPATHCRNVTNEDIHSAMVSLVNIFRNSEDQLQRHELRERALGEQVKKILTSIEKKQRALEPTKGMVSRLDERLSNVETILLQKEEREKANQKVTQDALGEIQRSLQSLAATVTRNLNSVPTNEPVENNLTTNDESVEKRLDATDSKIDAIKMEIENLKTILSRESLQALCPQATPQNNQFERHISETEDLLIKYELKLLEYGNCNKTSVDDLPLGEVTMADEAWHSKMTEVMERQEVEVKKIQELLSDAESMWKDLPRLADLRTSTNQTLEAIVSAKHDLLESYNTSLEHVSRQQRETSERLVATNGDLQQVLTQSNTMNERAYSELGRNLDVVLNEVQTLTKNEEILLQTADNVISTKNSVDYGVQHILQEVSELLNIQHKNMNRSIQQRFDTVQKVILTNQTVAIRNLSSNIDSEMLNIWRQIGNMYQQLTVNKITLEKLSEQTELYVNGTGIIMSNMTNKISTITTNMWQMDDNLNYLLGKLSLVSQEFNRIKTGLGNALDQLRASFRRTEEQLSDIGPGPHPIANADETTNNTK